MKRQWIDYIVILLGNTIYALGVVLFIVPGNLITGGTTGIALIVQHYWNIPISMFVLIFNLIMFTLGALILGKKFAITTTISTFYYPLILGIFEKTLSQIHLTDDILLNTLFAGVFIGVAIGLVIKMGASTGGMDIPPLIIHKLIGIPVSISMYVFDFIILLGQFSFSDSERLLYGIVLIFIYTFVLEKILVIGKQKIELKIISEKTSTIKEEILKEVDRGVTLLYGKTGFLEKDCEIILSIMSSRELIKVERLVHEIDENAFLVISSVNEVRGHGFSSQKQYIQTKK
jgi:uncharacterized membrane-anchored protein YitT (DUF2179 family)